MNETLLPPTFPRLIHSPSTRKASVRSIWSRPWGRFQLGIGTVLSDNEVGGTPANLHMPNSSDTFPDGL
jgi:hypothetical protein